MASRYAYLCRKIGANGVGQDAPPARKSADTGDSFGDCKRGFRWRGERYPWMQVSKSEIACSVSAERE